MKKERRRNDISRKLLIKLFDEVLAREIEERGVEGGELREGRAWRWEDLYFSEQRLNKKNINFNRNLIFRKFVKKRIIHQGDLKVTFANGRGQGLLQSNKGFTSFAIMVNVKIQSLLQSGFLPLIMMYFKVC